MNDIASKSLLEMASGAFLEQVDYEMAKVVDNIIDPNTQATAKRKVSITMELVPDGSRQNISVTFSTKLSLAQTYPLTTSLSIVGADSTGEVQVVENVPQIPGQLGMDGSEQAAPAVLKIIKFPA